MMREFQWEVLRPSRDVLVQEISSMNVRVHPIDPASAKPIFMCMFRLKEFFQHAFVKQLSDPCLSILSAREARPITLGLAKSVLGMVGEIEVPSHNRKAFVSQLHAFSDLMDALGSLLDATSREVNAPDIQSTRFAAKAKSSNFAFDNLLPRASMEFAKKIIFEDKGQSTPPFTITLIGFFAMGVFTGALHQVRPEGGGIVREFECGFTTPGAKGFLNAKEITFFSEFGRP